MGHARNHKGKMKDDSPDIATTQTQKHLDGGLALSLSGENPEDFHRQYPEQSYLDDDLYHCHPIYFVRNGTKDTFQQLHILCGI